MALINCPECGREISDSVYSCPNCGFQLRKKRSKALPIILVLVFVIAAGAFAYIYYFRPNSIMNQAATPAPTSTPAPTAVEIQITPENFNDYFAVSVEVSKFSLDKTLSYMGLDYYDASGGVTLRIDAKSKFDMDNVSFTIVANGGASYKGLVAKEENIQFRGIMPQSGTYESSKKVTIDVGGVVLIDGLTYNNWSLTITNASGTITK